MSSKITNLAGLNGPFGTGIVEFRGEDISNGIANQTLSVISKTFEGAGSLELGSYVETGTIFTGLINYVVPTTLGLSSNLTIQCISDPGSEVVLRSRSTLFLQSTASSITFSPVTTRVQFNNTSPYAYKTAGGTWGTLSDSRLKHSIRDINNALDKILTLHPVHFEFINHGENVNPSGTRTGFIAQEFEQVLPGHTFEIEPMLEADKQLLGEGVKAKGIDADLVPYLVKAIQELKAELDTVKAELATLKG